MLSFQPRPQGLGGCWRGQCRGVGCPEPPPGHMAAPPRAFCCQKAAAGGFSHSRAPRLNSSRGWGPRCQLAPITCGCVIPLCSTPQRSCSGGVPALVGQCCPGHWFGWMWPSGTLWSAQNPPGAWGHFSQRDPSTATAALPGSTRPSRWACPHILTASPLPAELCT